MSDIIRYEEKADDKYKPTYPNELLKYVESNGNSQGYFYQIRITEKIANEWAEKYPEWKDALELIDYAKQYSIDNTFNTAIEKCMQIKDIDSILTLLIKRIDLTYRYEKDSGALKAKEQEKRTFNKTKKSDINIDDLLQKANELLTKE